jgi:hypothetical protein
MISKKILHTSIKKVFLDLKEVEHFVFWDLHSRKLQLKSLDNAYNTHIMSSCTLNFDSSFDSSFVIREPDQLLKMIDIMYDQINLNINLSYGDNYIELKDSSFDSQYIIAYMNYIPDYIMEKKKMEPEEPISYDVQIELTSDFVEKFIKAKKANKSSLVSIWTKDTTTHFQLGENNSFTNKIKFSMEMPGIFDMEKLSFSADIIQAVLDRNKGGKGRMSVDPGGLMKLYFREEFESNLIESTYFLVAQDNI